VIRVLLGSALPVLGLGLAAAFVGPSLVAPSGGEAILVGNVEPAAEFEPAGFAGEVCSLPLLFAHQNGPSGSAAANSAPRIFAVERLPDAGLALGITEIPPGHSAEHALLLMIVDPSGRVVAAGHPAALKDAGLVATCDTHAPDAKPVGAI
jgi:hypothetical protein